MELRDYLRGLRRHWFAILLMTAIGVGVGYGWTYIQTPVYEANASGYVAPQGSGDVGTNSVADGLAKNKVPSYLQIAGWRTVADRVIEDLGLRTTAEELVKRVSVTNPPGTVVMTVTAKGPSPDAAHDLADSWIKSMIVEIDAIEGDGTPDSAPVTVIARESASLPTTPIFPDLQTAMIVGGVIGFGFGIAFALIRTVSDRRIRAVDEVEDKTGVAVVGTIPMAQGLTDGQRVFAESAGSGPSFAVSEAMRALRTNLQFMDVDNPPRTIVVTSPLPGDGKSTIACNLALTLAASGATVVLVDGDLRRSAVAETMGLPGGAGLSDVLAGRAALSEVLQRTPKSNNLLVLTAGSSPPNPSEVLGSERMHTLIADLTKHATVIIDAPPLLPVTDGAVLTHQADGAFIVVSLGKTTYDLLDKALDTLHKARGRALGIVLNKAPLRGVDSNAYSYEYRREYTTGTTAPKRPKKSKASAVTEIQAPSDSDAADIIGPDELVEESTSPTARRGSRHG